jgi:hypothetical protein
MELEWKRRDGLHWKLNAFLRFTQKSLRGNQSYLVNFLREEYSHTLLYFNDSHILIRITSSVGSAFGFLKYIPVLYCNSVLHTCKVKGHENSF